MLLGASFGGVLAYLYANRHPDEVVGLVLLDAMFPDEMALEVRWPPEERYEAFEAEDENEFVERLSHYKVMLAAEQHIGDEPPVPLIYLASEQDRRDEPHVPGYNEEWLSGSSTPLRPYASTYVDTDLGPAHKLPPAANHVARYPAPHIGGTDSKQ